jgi:hypothetical protein
MRAAGGQKLQAARIFLAAFSALHRLCRIIYVAFFSYFKQ